MNDEQKKFFTSLGLTTEQQDQLIENESLFDTKEIDVKEFDVKIKKLENDLKTSKDMYRERFFSIEDKPADEKPADEKPDTEVSLDDVLKELG